MVYSQISMGNTSVAERCRATRNFFFQTKNRFSV